MRIGINGASGNIGTEVLADCRQRHRDLVQSARQGPDRRPAFVEAIQRARAP